MPNGLPTPEPAPGWFHPTAADIDLIRSLAKGPVIEPFCGNGYLLSMLDGHRLGIDKVASSRRSGGLTLLRDTLEGFLESEDGRRKWLVADTVILCYPPCGYMFHDPSLMAVKSVADHQTLLLITPRPYGNNTIAGTPGMWKHVFFNMDLVSKHEVGSKANADMLYVLRNQDGTKTAGFTKDAILGDHTLWDMDMDENYMFGRRKAGRARRTPIQGA